MGHQTTAKKKRGALPHSIWETSADPDSLLAIACFKNNWPQRFWREKLFYSAKNNKFAQNKTYPKNKDRVLYSVYRVNDLAVEIKMRKKLRKIQPTFCEERTEQTGGEGGGKEGGWKEEEMRSLNLDC